MTKEELNNPDLIPNGWRVLRPDNLYSRGAPSDSSDRDFIWNGKKFCFCLFNVIITLRFLKVMNITSDDYNSIKHIIPILGFKLCVIIY